MLSMRSVVPLVLLAAVLAGCSSKRKTSDRDLAIVNRVQLQAMIREAEGKGTLVLIDVRSARPYAEGHIPGALNIPVIDIRQHDARLAEARTIVVYGSGDPNDLLSWAAAKKLIALGYRNVHDFRGGMEEWQGIRASQSPLIDTRMEEKANRF